MIEEKMAQAREEIRRKGKAFAKIVELRREIASDEAKLERKRRKMEKLFRELFPEEFDRLAVDVPL